MRRNFLPAITACLLAVTACTEALPAAIEVPDKIRVVIADGFPDLKLSVRGEYTVTAVETDQVLKRGDTFFNMKVEPAEYGIRFGNDEFKIHAINIVPDKEPSVYLNDRLYRGELQILRNREGTLIAINVVGLEDYLKGVLFHEVSNKWPMEAIKAQAIVSRTFALYQAQENRAKQYYLKADVSSQVYGGAYAEKYRTSLAVDKTKGMVLAYRGKILPAFFHATCGGKTEDANRLWKVNIPPLKGIECAYCRRSPHFRWHCAIPLSEFEEKLNSAGYKISGINYAEVTRRSKSGRALQVLIKAKGAKVRIDAKHLRHILGASLVKSTNFSISLKDKNIYFEGKGWGHGVGMCQWGAFSMAKRQKTADQILKYYYPGARIIRLEER